MFRTLFRIITLPDKILGTVLLLLAVTSVLYLQANHNRTELEIYLDNELWRTYNLQQDQMITIREGIIAEINSGRIRMKESICTNQICVQQGYSSSVPIICVPEKIALIIKRREEPDMMITR
jgi:hypothetical protein